MSSNSVPKVFEFRCDACGELHRGSPSFAHEKPFPYFLVPPEERERRISLTEDTCIIQEDDPDVEPDYFIRRTLDLPIHGAEPLTWGVWISQSKTSFERYVETFAEDQSGDGSFGWLAVTLPPYLKHNAEDPVALECNVHWAGPKQRPRVEIKPCEHPLYKDQRDGITWDRAIQIVRSLLHGHN